VAIVYVCAAAVSAVGVDVLMNLVGMGTHEPVARPVVLLTLAAVGVWKQRGGGSG